MSHTKCRPTGKSRRAIYNRNTSELEEKQVAEGDEEQQKNKNLIPSFPKKEKCINPSVGELGETSPLDPQSYTSPETLRISQGKAEVMFI